VATHEPAALACHNVRLSYFEQVIKNAILITTRYTCERIKDNGTYFRKEEDAWFSSWQETQHIIQG
jgi:hypothetical protein